MSQHTSKLKELKDENKSKRIHCQDTFTKILITSKIKYLGEILVEDGQNLWNSGSNQMEGCIMSMIWEAQHCQCQSSSNFYVFSQISKPILKVNTLKLFFWWKWQTDFKIHTKYKQPRVTSTIGKKSNSVRGVNIK